MSLIWKRNYIIKQLYNDIHSNILKNGDKISNINGYITNIKRFKKLTFIDLMDGTTSTPLKIVIKSNDYNLNIGQSLSLNNWICKKTPNRKQSFELIRDEHISSILNINNTQKNSIIQQPNELDINLSTLRNLPLQKFKNNYMANLLRFRSAMELTIFNVLQNDLNFIKVDPPIITTNDTEGNNETFKLISSNNKIFPLNQPNSLNLTVSTQLHLEILAQSLSNVYSYSPCFRAERSDTGRHLTEFYMLELETTEFNTLPKLIALTHKFIINTVGRLLQNQNFLLDWNQHPLPIDIMSIDNIVERWNNIINLKNWHEIEYIDVIKQLNLHKDKFKSIPPNLQNLNKINITTEHEKWVSSNLFNNGFVFIKNYPRTLKPFYMKLNNDNLNTVQCFDLIFPELGEIIGGSMREDNYSNLNSLLPQDLIWYGKLRDSTYRTSGGFGLGIERFIAYLMGVKNIKDTIPFYRSAKSKITL